MALELQLEVDKPGAEEGGEEDAVVDLADLLELDMLAICCKMVGFSVPPVKGHMFKQDSRGKYLLNVYFKKYNYLILVTTVVDLPIILSRKMSRLRLKQMNPWRILVRCSSRLPLKRPTLMRVSHLSG